MSHSPYVLSLLATMRADLDANLASQASLKTQASEIVQSIKALEGTIGYAPTSAPASVPVQDASESESPNYKGMTIRAAIRHWFAVNGNESVHYKDLAMLIGKSKASVASVMSVNPEFICVQYGAGQWQCDPAFYNTGWTTVGK